jgi:hypothetical protein
MNKYKEAIELNLAKQFLLGRGKYFVRHRDWGGHDITDTYSEIFLLEQEEGEQKVYDSLNKDIPDVLQSEFLSTHDLGHILGIIWSYFLDRKEEGKLKIDWEISLEIENLIKKQIEEHKRNNAELGSIEWTINSLKNRFGYDLLHSNDE